MPGMDQIQGNAQQHAVLKSEEKKRAIVLFSYKNSTTQRGRGAGVESQRRGQLHKRAPGTNPD